MYRVIRCVCLLPVVLACSFAYAQFGRAIVNVTFGDNKKNPGPPLPSANTSFRYTTDSCPPPGYYTVTNSLYRCPSYRIGRSTDNTFGNNYGYTMLVNDTVTATSKLLYIDTLTEALCPGTEYQFSAAFLNVEIPGYCYTSNVHLPAFTFAVETTDGTLIQKANSGSLNYDYDPVRLPSYHEYGVTFVMPGGVNGLVLKIKDDSAAYSPCGYAFAVDDIKFRAIGPKATALFDGTFEGEFVKAACFQDNKTVGISGSVALGYTDVALQWQQSTDSGATWIDIPGATGSHYSRSFPVADTFLYRLRASEKDRIGNQNCSVVSNVLKMEVDDVPMHYSISSNSPVCSGSNLQLSADGAATYVWTGPNGFYDNVSYAHISQATPADSGTYHVQVKSFGGCVKEDSLRVQIIGTLTAGSLGPDLSVCKGKAVPLHARGGSSFVWSPPAGLSGLHIAGPLASPDVSTGYTVLVTDSLGCSATQSVNVNVLNKVAVKANISGPYVLCRPADSATFTDSSKGIIISRQWNFGNGSASTLPVPPVQHYAIHNSLGYTVTLSVADAAGCSDTAYRVLEAVNNCFIAVPSAFTPNGDGVNDYLYPLNAYKATNLTFRVFSRYGQLVFETDNRQQKWDGRKNGLLLPAGVYVWQLTYTDASHQRVALYGSSLLLR